jgi:hypothetical protein
MQYRRVAIPFVAVACLAGMFLLPGSAGAAWTFHRPSAPTNVSVVGSTAFVPITVSWSTPVSDGGSPILYYTVSDSYTGAIGGGCRVSAPVTSCSFSPPRRTGGQYFDTRYVIRVKAHNAIGTSPADIAPPIVLLTY